MKNKNIKILAMVGLVCLMLIIVVAAILQLTFKKPIDLYNIDQVNTGMTDREIDELEKLVGESLSSNQEYKNRTGIKVLIRPASFERKVKDEVTLYKFLIDIDEFKDTYEVSFGLVSGKGFYEPPTVTCPLPVQMKYPEKNCTGQQAAPRAPTFEFELPHYFRLASGEFVTVTADYSSDGQEYLNVRVSSCGNSGIIDAARMEVEKWIKSLEYEPSGYEIVIPEFCDGEAG